MDDLIEALQILKKYSKDTKYPTHCEHDILMVTAARDKDIPEEDAVRLEELGFDWSDEYECWCSFKFGSS